MQKLTLCSLVLCISYPCAAITCLAPADLANGTTTCPGSAPYAVGTECPVACSTGYVASSSSVSCSAQGTWSSATCSEFSPVCCDMPFFELSLQTSTDKSQQCCRPFCEGSAAVSSRVLRHATQRDASHTRAKSIADCVHVLPSCAAGCATTFTDEAIAFNKRIAYSFIPLPVSTTGTDCACTASGGYYPLPCQCNNAQCEAAVTITDLPCGCKNTTIWGTTKGDTMLDSSLYAVAEGTETTSDPACMVNRWETDRILVRPAWYKFTASANASVTLDTCWFEAASNAQTPTFHCDYYNNDNVTNCPDQINTVIMVYEAGTEGTGCTGKICLRGNDDATSGRQCSKLTVPVQAGKQYIIAVGVYNLWGTTENAFKNNNGPFRLLMTSSQACAA